MIVCHCKATNDRQIRTAVACGARTCCDIGRLCGAGTVCGGCVPTVREILRDEARAILQSGGREQDRDVAA